jgi:hypothetical protein
VIKAELDSESETDPSYSHNENELIARNKKEEPLIISFPLMKTENVVSYIFVCACVHTSQTFMNTCYLWLVYLYVHIKHL